MKTEEIKRKAKGRMTRHNPDIHGNEERTYRIPLYIPDAQSLTLQNEALFGDIANKLGRYEDIGTIEELEELAKAQK